MSQSVTPHNTASAVARPARFPRELRSAWQADAGDGTYRNPVLHADYSDPDAVRVGDDFWMTASSFCHVPGLPILHSRDLVNWTLVAHALPTLVPHEHFRAPRHGGGVWAPAFRHHAGLFWITYPDPDFGLYVITAKDPRGPWSEPHLLKAGRGLIDPCPLWDEDGRAWLVHGWARSRSGINNRITLHEVSPDLTRILDEGQVIINGDEMEGWHTIEGPKLYKRGGYYYVFAPAGGVAEGYQAVFRSADIRGPYEGRITLAQGSTPINGPHQGAWVDTPAGEHWFLHFQELPAHGRVVHLQPMRWLPAGWPVMGDDADADGTGDPVLTHRKPSVPQQSRAVPATSDLFEDGRPGLQWQWQGNPEPDWIVPQPKGALGLRLRAVPAVDGATFWTSTNLLLQKFPAPVFAAEVTVGLPGDAPPGTAAGLVAFGYDYGWAGLRVGADGNVQLIQVLCAKADKGGVEIVQEELAWPRGAPVLLRIEVGDDRAVRFFRSAAATDALHPLGTAYQAISSKWVGAKVGLFARAAAATPATHAEFRAFTVGA